MKSLLFILFALFFLKYDGNAQQKNEIKSGHIRTQIKSKETLTYNFDSLDDLDAVIASVKENSLSQEEDSKQLVCEMTVEISLNITIENTSILITGLKTIPCGQIEKETKNLKDQLLTMVN